MEDDKKNYTAFPVVAENVVYDSGMTLRDYFAAKALQGHLASEYYAGFNNGEENTMGIAANMYAFAAMLKQREI